MKDQGSVYQRMHCPCIYYLILFQCDIFQITYNSHIHNITVDFRCPYTFMPQQLLECRDIRSIIFPPAGKSFSTVYSHSSLPKQKLQTTFLNNACNSVHKQQELFRRIAETKEAGRSHPS